MNQVSRYCTNCGHQLNVGRYCTNCGARISVLSPDTAAVADYPTAVRPGPIPPVGLMPAAPPPPPPVLEPAPSSARYPLYADSVPRLEQSVPAYTPVAPAGRSPLPWIIAFLVLAAIAVTGGALLLLGSSGDDDPATGDDRDRRGIASDRATPLEPTDVTVPETAPASRDESGAKVTFSADHMLDGDPRTSWRMPGNGTGAVLTFTFDEPVDITRVGIINGYAKTDPPHDWYAGNRRITQVVWVFDDGTEVIQDLGESQSLQTIEVIAGPTRAVEARLLGISEPGTGPDSRDFTAISDVEFSGS